MIKRMMRWLFTLGSLLFIAVALTNDSALASPDVYDPLKITTQVSPAELQGPQNVTVSMNIYNDGDSVVDAIVIKDEQKNEMETLSALGEGDGVERVYTVVVTQAHIDQGYIPFYVAWEQGAGGSEKEVRASFAVAQSVVELTFERTATPKIAHVGQEVILTYTLRNTGNTDLLNFEITDEAILKKPLKLDVLSQGQKKTFNYKYTMGEEDVDSIPRVTYQTPTNTPLNMTKDPLTLVVARPDLLVELKTDRDTVSPGEEVILYCRLVNRGNVEYSGIVITCQPNSKEKSDLPTLKPGKDGPTEYVQPFYVLISQSTVFSCTVTALDSAGQEVSVASNTLEVRVNNAPPLAVSANAQPSTLSGPGEVTVSLALLNNTLSPMTDVTISELSMGILKKIGSLAVGETIVDRVFSVDGPISYTFTITGYDSGGNLCQAIATPIEIAFETLLVTPDVLPSTSPTTAPASSTSWLWTLLVILGIVVVLIIGCVAALVVMGLRSRRLKGEDTDAWRDPKKTPKKKAVHTQEAMHAGDTKPVPIPPHKRGTADLKQEKENESPSRSRRARKGRGEEE